MLFLFFSLFSRWHFRAVPQNFATRSEIVSIF